MGVVLPKKVGWVLMLILTAWIRREIHFQGGFGPRSATASKFLSIWFLTLALVSRETCFRQNPSAEAVTHRLSDGWEFSGYHIGISGKGF